VYWFFLNLANIRASKLQKTPFFATFLLISIAK